MSQEKKLDTPSAVLQALIDGKRIASASWPDWFWVKLQEECPICLVDDRGKKMSLANLSHFVDWHIWDRDTLE